MFDVANWVAHLNGENGPGGTPSHETLSVSPQGALEISLFNLLPWSETINVLELKAVYLALKRFKDQYQNQTVLVATDNSSSLHRQTRRNPLGRDVHFPVENHDLVPTLPDNSKSQAHSGCLNATFYPVQ